MGQHCKPITHWLPMSRPCMGFPLVNVADPWVTHGSPGLLMGLPGHPWVSQGFTVLTHGSPMDRPWVAMSL